MTLERTKGGWSVQLRFGMGRRKRFPMPNMTEERARTRMDQLEQLASLLSSRDDLDIEALLSAAAVKVTDLDFSRSTAAIRDVATGKVPAAAPRGPRTFRDVAELWLSGELHCDYPEDVGDIEAGTRARYRSILTVVAAARVGEASFGSLPVERITLADAETAKASIPQGLGQGTRRHYALVIRKVLSLSVYPLRLRESNPIPPKFVPSQGKGSVFAFLYPDEEAQLLRFLGSRGEPEALEDGLVIGTLHREGMRVSELLGLTWGDLDLSRGVIILDENKTDDPRSWSLGADVVRALTAYRGKRSADELVFSLFVERHQAERFRSHLVAAGIRRKELFERSGPRRPIRLHDGRGSFVSVSFATGRDEIWVMDRTGHRSSQMVNHYRRAARRLAEVGVKWFEPLDRSLSLGGPHLARGVDPQVEMPALHITGSTAPDPSTATTEPKKPATSVAAPQTSVDAAAELPGVARAYHGVAREQAATVSAPQDTPQPGVEEALASALTAAIGAQQWTLAAAIVAELGERRRARTAPSVPSLADARRKKDEGGK